MRPPGLQLRVRPVEPPVRRGADRQPEEGRLRRDPAQPGPVHHVHPMRPVHPRDHPDRRAPGDARGNHAEINVFPGHPVDNPLAGNVVNLCPVGALLDKDFLHKQRAWFLSKHDAICTRCSTGCNVKAEENRGQIWRFTPRHNPLVNDYWICDEGRASYKAANDDGLLTSSYARSGRRPRLGPDRPGPEPGRADPRRRSPATAARSPAVVSPFLTVEEAYLLATYLKELNPANVLALGPGPDPGRGPDLHARPDQGADRRHQLRRPPPVHDPRREVPEPQGGRGRPGPLPGRGHPLRRDRRAGRRRASSRPSTSRPTRSTPGGPRPRRRRSGAGSSSWSSRTRWSPRWPSWPTRSSRAGRSPRRPAATSTPTAGSSTPRRPCRLATGRCPTSTSSPILMGRAGGPVRSRDVLAELAGAIPAFSVADGGVLPEFGVADRREGRRPRPSRRAPAAGSTTPGRSPATTRGTGRASRARRAARMLEPRSTSGVAFTGASRKASGR